MDVAAAAAAVAGDLGCPLLFLLVVLARYFSILHCCRLPETRSIESTKMIHEVVERLFLTDQETIETAKTSWECPHRPRRQTSQTPLTVQAKEFGLIVSIGCKPTLSSVFSHCTNMCFPQFTDEPTTCLLMFWDTIIPIIDFYRVTLQQSVAIHCVYGQSRSVSTIIAYICRTIDSQSKMNLQDAVDLLKTVKPSISINPGFLSQLYYYSHCCETPRDSLQWNIFKHYLLLFADYSIEKDSVIQSFHENKDKLVEKKRKQHLDIERGSNKRSTDEECDDNESPTKKQCIDINSMPSTSSTAGHINQETACIERRYCCKKCKTDLFGENSVIPSSFSTDEFIRSNIDDFWRNYGIPKQILQNTIPVPGHLVIVPPTWMLQQGKDSSSKKSKGESPLLCPSCKQTVGSRRKGGNYFGGFIPVDLFAVQESHAILKRQR